MFVDVQQKVLFWMLCAWEEDYTGYIIDYGTWPDQHRLYFTLRDLWATIGRSVQGAGLEGQIFAALEKLCAERLSRVYRREDGAEMRIDRCLIDTNRGQSTDVVYQFCRQSSFAGILLPSHAKYVGASSIPFSEYKRNRGDRVGLHRYNTVRLHSAIRYITPADALAGRTEAILTARDAKLAAAREVRQARRRRERIGA